MEWLNIGKLNMCLFIFSHNISIYGCAVGFVFKLPAFWLRERNEEGEASVPKYAKTDEKSSQASVRTQPVTSSPLESKAEGSQKGQRTLDQKMNQSSVDMNTKSVMESRKSEEKHPNGNIPAGKSAAKKRKELDDLVEDAASLELVFEAKELDLEEDLGDGDGKGGGGMKKKRKLEIKGNGFPEGSSENRDTGKLLVKAFVSVF